MDRSCNHGADSDGQQLEAYSQDKRLRSHISKHSDILTRYAKAISVYGGLLVVRGWVKTSAWASIAFRSRQKIAGTLQANVRFVSQSAPQWTIPLAGGMLYRFQSGSSNDIPTAPGLRVSDQCIFISYYIIASRLMFFTSIKANAGPDDPPRRGPGPGPSPLSADVDDAVTTEPSEVRDCDFHRVKD